MMIMVSSTECLPFSGSRLMLINYLDVLDIGLLWWKGDCETVRIRTALSKNERYKNRLHRSTSDFRRE